MEPRCARQHRHLRTAGPSRSVWSERVGRGGGQIWICCWDRYVDELYGFHTLVRDAHQQWEIFFLYSSFKSTSWGSFTSPTPFGAIIWPSYKHVTAFVEVARWSWFRSWFRSWPSPGGDSAGAHPQSPASVFWSSPGCPQSSQGHRRTSAGDKLGCWRWNLRGGRFRKWARTASCSECGAPWWLTVTMLLNHVTWWVREKWKGLQTKFPEPWTITILRFD